VAVLIEVELFVHLPGSSSRRLWKTADSLEPGGEKPGGGKADTEGE